MDQNNLIVKKKKLKKNVIALWVEYFKQNIYQFHKNKILLENK